MTIDVSFKVKIISLYACTYLASHYQLLFSTCECYSDISTKKVIYLKQINRHMRYTHNSHNL